MQIVSGFPTNKKIIISVMKVGSYASSTLNMHSHKFRRIIGQLEYTRFQVFTSHLSSQMNLIPDKYIYMSRNQDIYKLGNICRYLAIQIYAMSWLVSTCSQEIILCDSGGVWQFAKKGCKYQEIQLYAMSWLVATCSQEIILYESSGIWQFAGNGWKYQEIQLYSQ